MDIGGAALNRIDQDLVDELHHRRIVVGVGVDAGHLGFFVAPFQHQIVQVPAAHVGDRVAHSGEHVFDDAQQLTALHQNRLDHAIGVELDFIQRVRLHGVGNADKQPLAALEQRQRMMLVDQRLADQVHRHVGWNERAHIHHRHAELIRGDTGEASAVDQVVVQQPSGKGGFVLGRIGHSLAHVGFGQDIFRNQPARHAR